MAFLNKFGGGSIRSFGFSRARIPIMVEYLVIAGGGGGGSGWNGNGGGGAGGYRSSVIGELSGRNTAAESRFEAIRGTTYTITIGGGGGPGSNGGDTSIAGSGLSTITSNGGGFGQNSAIGNQRSDNVPPGGGASGGSGGGGAVQCCWPAYGLGGAGIAGQGYSGGGVYGADNFWQGIPERYEYPGGGGGAGSAGDVLAPGRGIKSSITGTSIGRAGGGGCRARLNADSFVYYNNCLDEVGVSVNVGTVYGGGTSTVSAPANFGGGGREQTNGGSGVVIIRVPDYIPAASTTGASVVATTITGYRVYQFNALGTITW